MVSFLLTEVDAIIAQCKEIGPSTDISFEKKPNHDGIGCYLCTPQEIPIVVTKMENLHDKLKQMASDYVMLLDGKVLDEKTTIKDLYKGCKIKVFSKSIKKSKVTAGSSTLKSSSLKQLRYNKDFLNGIQDTIKQHIMDEDDRKVVNTLFKNALEKLGQ